MSSFSFFDGGICNRLFRRGGDAPRALSVKGDHAAVCRGRLCVTRGIKVELYRKPRRSGIYWGDMRAREY